MGIRITPHEYMTGAETERKLADSAMKKAGVLSTDVLWIDKLPDDVFRLCLYDRSPAGKVRFNPAGDVLTKTVDIAL